MSELKRFECIEDFFLDKYDENGFWTEEQMVIKKGEVFECDLEDKERIAGSHLHTLRLIGNGKWLELTEESLKEYFKEEGEQNEQCTEDN